MPYDIPRPAGYRIQPFKLQDDEALVASMAQQLLKARLAQARAAAGGGGGGRGGGKGREKKEKGEWVMKYNPETKRYDKVWVAGGTGEERKINMKGEDYNKTADWIDSNPDAQRLLGVLRNGKASNAAKQKALSEFRSLKGAEALSGMAPEAVDEVIERQAKPYKEQVEAEKKEIAGAGKGLLSNIEIGLDRLGTFFRTIGDDAETTLAKRRASLERQQAIREADPYLREQSRREAEGEGLWDRSEGATGVAANVAGALLSDPSAVPIAVGAGLGAAIGGPVGAGIGASIAGAGGAASGDTYLGERLAQDDRLSEAEKAQAYEEGKLSEMGINAAVNAIPFGGGAVTRAGRTALAAAGRGALGREAAEGAAAFARGGAWRTAADTASYAERFGGLAGEAAEQAVAKAAMRPIAADRVRQSERGVMGAIKYNAVPEAAMASGLNAGAMLESNLHYNELTGQNDSITQNVPEAAALGLLFGIPAGIGGAIRSRRMAAELTSPETRLAAHQQELEKQGKVGENLPAEVSSAPASGAGPSRPSGGEPGAVPGAGPRRPSGDGGGEAAGPSPFSEEQIGRLNEMWARKDEWYGRVKESWESDTEFQSAYQDLARQWEAKNPDPESIARARDRFMSVLGRFMLRDEKLISGDRTAGPRAEAANGERGFPETGTGATIRGAESAGEGRADQRNPALDSKVGTDSKNAAGTAPNLNTPPPRAGDTPYPRSWFGRGTGGRPAALEDSPRGLGIAWAGRKPFDERPLGESGLRPAAIVRPDAGAGAGGAQPPAKPSAGSPAARGGAAPAVAPGAPAAKRGKRGKATKAAPASAPQQVSAPDVVIRRPGVSDAALAEASVSSAAATKRGAEPAAPAETVPSDAGWDRQLELWDKAKADKSQAAMKTARRQLTAAGGKPNVAGVAPVADVLRDAHGLNAQGVADLIERVARGQEPTLTPKMRDGLAKLADFYNAQDKSGVKPVPVVHRVHSGDLKSFPPRSKGRRIMEFLDGPLLNQLERSNERNLMSRMLREISESEFGSDKWNDGVANLLNVVWKAVPDVQAFFNSVYKSKVVRAGEALSGADVAFDMSPRKAIEKTAKANKEGTPKC